MECCTDHYFHAAMQSWEYLTQGARTGHDPCFENAWRLYHWSVAGLIEAGQRFGRFDPRCRLVVQSGGGGPISVPVMHTGFAWHPGDFQRLDIANDAMSKPLTRAQRRPGIGVPVVVQRFHPDQRSRFVRDRAAFAATVVLRTDSRPGEVPSPVLEICEPVRADWKEVGDNTMALAADFTAPLGIVAGEAIDTSWEGFLRPGDLAPEAVGLIFLEPYQPGKIPVVFVHGLLSDPATWLDLVNDLRACPGVAQNYQFWAFRYATGQAFVKSAAELRRDCNEAIQVCDPHGVDPALRRMVLIGHSMGGLVSKLQVTHSDSMLWSTVSDCPPHSLRMDDTTRRIVYERLFFEPQPFVERVIFIGTPHGGSSIASRSAGRIGSMLVRHPPEDQRRLAQLNRDNPGMLKPAIGNRLPTSIDLLQPDSPTLMSVRLLRVSPRVHLHSIIGTGRPMLVSGPADGVVPVESARHAGVDTELFVDTTHNKLHRHPDTVREVACILSEHARMP
jgi:pimeloyl-ACP methyl ester carboxylesterase